MDYKDYFLPLAHEVNTYLDSFFAAKKKEAGVITPVARGLWEKLEAFIVGGKRLRGGLVRLGYEVAGGKDFEAILPIAAAIEIMHGAILVHDDIIDQDTVRHGRPTVHTTYDLFYKENYSKRGNSLHYGESMAIVVGDVGFFEAAKIISESKFSPNLKIRALTLFNEFMVQTGYGEALDVDLSYREKITEEDVITINTLKTAHYSIIGPLSLGATLAEAKGNLIKAFGEYGFPGGIAYQLQDDIIGLYGETEISGKPNDSDVKEGKNTILYTEALKRANPKQKARLVRLWGNSEVTSTEVEEARKIIEDTAALEYCRNLALKYAEDGKKAVTKITKNKELQEVFNTLADFVVKRDK